MIRALSWLFRTPPFRAVYRRARSAGSDPFSSRALAALGIDVTTGASDLARIPSRGALVVVANHPHGLADGLAALDVLHRVRPDVRVIANHVASAITELRDECFFVDPFGGPHAARRSRSGLSAALAWLRNGGALVVFPSGEVAGSLGAEGAPLDGAWLPGAARLAVRAGAPVLPVRIDGRNSPLFYAAGRVHPRLRTVLLPWELLRLRRSSIHVHVAQPLEPPGFADATSCTAAARAASDRLARAAEPVVPPVPPALIAAEIAGLPRDALLLESGSYQVWCATASKIRATLREIGRLREITFRVVGEGTGRAIDLDEFDRWYEHLFVWNAARQEIVGAYRIGRADRIVQERGVAGLYTNTLFRYDPRLLGRMPAAALELGRSFVRTDYQRHSNALLLLWKGIGRVVAREPHYRVLFGPVSISSRYRDSSQRTLMSFLYQNHYSRELGELVAALNPVPGASPPAVEGRAPADVTDVDRLVSAMENDGKGVPVLLRQYLRLNAKLLGFNRDPQFGDVLDALMMVDLAEVDPAILSRYVGRGTVAALRAA